MDKLLNMGIDKINELRSERDALSSQLQNADAQIIALTTEGKIMRELLAEADEVCNDLINKTDLYLGINDAYERHDKWETRLNDFVSGSQK